LRVAGSTDGRSTAADRVSRFQPSEITEKIAKACVILPARVRSQEPGSFACQPGSLVDSSGSLVDFVGSFAGLSAEMRRHMRHKQS
jgi:hypothetical protein